jgi:septum formation protein
MLTEIGGTTHEVFTGVCLKSNIKTVHFFDRSEVTIKQLNNDEIWHYIKNYKPFDKAGSYGIQDWFGYTAVEKINGCFYNVMGLPINKVYSDLKEF